MRLQSVSMTRTLWLVLQMKLSESIDLWSIDLWSIDRGGAR